MTPTLPGTAEGGDGWRRSTEGKNEVERKERETDGDVVIQETYLTSGSFV